ncbi:MAG: NlpC/P60 family protein [Betaproteobacteria bacterium]|nr:NlpC/P60 family protein [Betaproteobacteria bacterium]
MRFKLLYLSIFCSLSAGCGTFPPGSPAAPAQAETPVEITSPRQPSRSGEALLQALLSLGIDYRYGGQSPTTGFDCSGLVAHVFLEAYGLRLPRNTKAQSGAGTAVASGELEAGDLVFFNTLNRPYSHVGIYLGDGRFVHAPKAGTRVRVEKMDGPYWGKRFDGARRIQI